MRKAENKASKADTPRPTQQKGSYLKLGPLSQPPSPSFVEFSAEWIFSASEHEIEKSRPLDLRQPFVLVKTQPGRR